MWSLLLISDMLPLRKLYNLTTKSNDVLNLKYGAKFYVGIVLIILSLIIGKITTFYFITRFGDQLVMWTSLIVYIISWPMLIVGVWWVGEEYAESIQKYFQYKFYKESLKKTGRKVIDKTKEKTKGAYLATKVRTEKVKERVRNLRK